MGAELVREQEMVEGYWDYKHRLAFIPFKQKWPDSQRQKKFGAADVGVPIGRIWKRCTTPSWRSRPNRTRKCWA